MDIDTCLMTFKQSYENGLRSLNITKADLNVTKRPATSNLYA
jgi:hypothetical protein